MFDTENTHEDDDRNVVAGPEHDEATQALLAKEDTTDADVQALLATTKYGDIGPSSSPDPLKPDVDRAKQLARRVATLLRRPEGSTVGETEKERAAWQVVTDARAEYVAAVHDVEAIEIERAEEDKAADEVVAAQIRSGETPQAPTCTDWEGESRTRRAIVRVAAEGVQVARSAFDRVAETERPMRAVEAVTRLKAAEAKMRKVAPGALAAIAEWLAARDLAVEVVEAGDEYRADTGMLDSESAAVLSAGRRAVQSVGALVASEHPAVTGHHLWAERQAAPPMHVREWMAEQSDGVFALAAIEAHEVEKGEEVSRLAHGLWTQVHPEDVRRGVEWRRSRLRK